MIVLDGRPTILGGKAEFPARYYDEVWVFQKDGTFLSGLVNGGEWLDINITLKSPRAFFGATEVPITLFDGCTL